MAKEIGEFNELIAIKYAAIVAVQRVGAKCLIFTTGGTIEVPVNDGQLLAKAWMEDANKRGSSN